MESTIYLISAFGRSETLALALKEAGLSVKVVELTSAFPEEYIGGPGPFPVVEREFLPEQRERLGAGRKLEQGLNFWLRQGPLEINGPMSEAHGEGHPGLKAWQNGVNKGEFERVWLGRFLSQWAAPVLHDSWLPADAKKSFPANASLRLLPESKEVSAHGFTEAQSRGVEVLDARKILTVQTVGSRLTGLEIEVEGSPRTLSAEQWIWCLSGFETSFAASPEALHTIFPRGVREPEWQWLSFAGSFSKGPWSEGLPAYSILLKDIYLPWTYANAVVLRRVDETQFRFWLKVPRARVGEIDARREWAAEIEEELHTRLPLAGWKVDSADWGVCPGSPIFTPAQTGRGLANWKNWDWISAETLDRLDLAARFEREGECFRRLSRLASDRNKKQGGPRDHTLHAP